MATCRMCGGAIEPERPKGTRYCLACSLYSKRGTGSAVAWCNLWARERRRLARMRRADLCSTVDPASVVFVREDRALGPVVVEWRGTAPSALMCRHV